MNWLALDIGGAHIKVANGLGFARSYCFPFWQDSGKLAEKLRQIINESPACHGLIVTMTGELADCFATKAEGVRSIVHAVKALSDRVDVRVYLADGRSVGPDQACAEPHLAAASNWHALARYAGQLVPTGEGLLIDIGSTTTDIIPFVDGMPVPLAINDTARLVCGELVYCGVVRTPICALVDQLPYRGQTCRVAAEWFSTTVDPFLILGHFPENMPTDYTADGKATTRAAAIDRLARTICADSESFSQEDAVLASRAILSAQLRRLEAAVSQVTERRGKNPEHVVTTGQGEFLARLLVRQAIPTATVVSLTDRLSAAASACAPAHALACLAREGAFA